MDKQHERDRQTIGRYEVFMRGNECDVIMQAGTIERNLTAAEAHAFLAWLHVHKDELYQAIQRNEHSQSE